MTEQEEGGLQRNIRGGTKRVAEGHKERGRVGAQEAAREVENGEDSSGRERCVRGQGKGKGEGREKLRVGDHGGLLGAAGADGMP